jgi:hypothetical protein
LVKGARLSIARSGLPEIIAENEAEQADQANTDEGFQLAKDREISPNYQG